MNGLIILPAGSKLVLPSGKYAELAEATVLMEVC